MKLNDTQIKNAKSKDKVYKLFDGGGLFVQVNKNSSKYWRLKYRFNGKERLLSIGVYPTVSLKQARQARDNAKQLLSQGIDPSTQKKRDKLRKRSQSENTFESIALRWHEVQLDKWSEQHAKRIHNNLTKRVFPFIGATAIKEVQAPEILQLLRKMEAEGIGEATRRVKAQIEQVFTFAIAEGLAIHNPVTGLEKALKPQPKVQHNAHLAIDELPQFLNTLESYNGHIQIKLAFKLILLTFVRTKELRLAKWEQFDLDKKQWVIPAENMKMDEKHIVPLSTQAIEILKELHQLNGRFEYVFPGIRVPKKPMSENTMIYALYRMGYKSRATVHGFRGTASTILNEHNFNRDWIERQLAHGERDEVRAAYNHAEYLKERTHMMQWYSDKIDSLRANEGNVIVANFNRN